MGIGKRLQLLRKEHGMSQQDVADKLHIGRSTYAGYELGAREMNYETLKRLSDLYQVTLDYLLGRTEHRFEKQGLTNVKELLLNSDLHWDGVHLTKEDLLLIRGLLEEIVLQRLNKDSNIN